MLASQTALGRVGLPDDIGDAIAALLSDKLGWMNAQRRGSVGRYVPVRPAVKGREPLKEILNADVSKPGKYKTTRGL